MVLGWKLYCGNIWLSSNFLNESFNYKVFCIIYRLLLNLVFIIKLRVDFGLFFFIFIVSKLGEIGYLYLYILVYIRSFVIIFINIRRLVGFMFSLYLYSLLDMFCYFGFYRREIVELGMIDFFVEEYFRRSLGEDYKCVSLISMFVVGLVDDYFVKVFGDIW